MSGVLVVDKPKGCTSHDVVQRLRRLLDERRVGHAGTLDPLATGVLVVAVGEGTKLVPYLQVADKRYRVTIRFGEETDTLDSEGEVVEERPVPELTESVFEQALGAFVGTHLQQVPAYSAVKVGGERLHRTARRGEQVEAPSREATLHSASVEAVSGVQARLFLHCGKGFFVRSLARDLARALGTVGHVVQLQRTASGDFTLKEAFALEALEKMDEPARALIPLEKACRGLTHVELAPSGVEAARHGRPLTATDVRGRLPDGDAPLALLSPETKLVAIGRLEADRIRISRGFVQQDAKAR